MLAQFTVAIIFFVFVGIWIYFAYQSSRLDKLDAKISEEARELARFDEQPI
jgi:Tfp pilus assembly protein PilO